MVESPQINLPLAPKNLGMALPVMIDCFVMLRDCGTRKRFLRFIDSEN
jgi:hypothetical protein